MNTGTNLSQLRLSRFLCAPALALAAILLAVPLAAHAQVDLYIANSTSNTVGEFDGATGNPIAGFTTVSGLNSPIGLALSNGTLFIANAGNGTVGDYNASTGAALNTSFVSGLTGPEGMVLSGNAIYVAGSDGTVKAFDATTGASLGGFTTITGLHGPIGLAVAGQNLFVTNYGTGANTVGEYNATTGSLLNANFLTPIGQVTALTVSGNDLWIANQATSSVNKFDATTGAAINSAAVTGQNNAAALAVSGNDLFVANSVNNTVGEYDTTTGSSISSFTSPAGLSGPDSIVASSQAQLVTRQLVVPDIIPEPGSTALLLLGLGALMGRRRRSA